MKIFKSLTKNKKFEHPKLVEYKKALDFIKTYYTQNELSNISFRELSFDLRNGLGYNFSPDELAALMIKSQGKKFDMKKLI